MSLFILNSAAVFLIDLQSSLYVGMQDSPFNLHSMLNNKQTVMFSELTSHLLG